LLSSPCHLSKNPKNHSFPFRFSAIASLPVRRSTVFLFSRRCVAAWIRWCWRGGPSIVVSLSRCWSGSWGVGGLRALSRGKIRAGVLIRSGDWVGDGILLEGSVGGAFWGACLRGGKFLLKTLGWHQNYL
jgi:hypothetical protein